MVTTGPVQPDQTPQRKRGADRRQAVKNRLENAIDPGVRQRIRQHERKQRHHRADHDENQRLGRRASDFNRARGVHHGGFS